MKGDVIRTGHPASIPSMRFLSSSYLKYFQVTPIKIIFNTLIFNIFNHQISVQFNVYILIFVADISQTYLETV